MDTSRKPGWYWQEGLAPGQKRYWDGQQWTERISEPPSNGTNSVMWGVILAVLVIAAVTFGVLNLVENLSQA